MVMQELPEKSMKGWYAWMTSWMPRRNARYSSQAGLMAHALKALNGLIGAGLLSVLLCCNAQNKSNMKNMEQGNAMNCDLEAGICLLPGAGDSLAAPASAPISKPIKVLYFTDPICSSCWGVEPQLRKLKLEYGDLFEIQYHMGGLLPDWSYNNGGISKPSDVAHHWDEVSLYYDMPIDGDVWLEDPLDSSYPPSIAFKAAELQDPDKALVFLRKLREMVFLQKKNITRWEHVEAAARYSGLDPMQLKADIEGDGKRLFQEDLDLARKMGVRGFPTMFFVDDQGHSELIYGSRPYEIYENAIQKAHPQAPKSVYAADWEHLFAHWPTMTAKEYSLLSGIERQAAEAQLELLVGSHQLRKITTKNGGLYMRE